MTQAIIDGQVVTVEVIKERKIFFVEWVLVKYICTIRDGGTTLYEQIRAEWILKNKLINN